MGTMAGELPRVVPQLQHVRLLAHFGAHFGTKRGGAGKAFLIVLFSKIAVSRETFGHF